MRSIFERIWELALPYQDKRDDKGHAELTLKYAQRLLMLEKGDEDIVIPAIILHDLGWSQLPREKRFVIFDRDTPEKEKLSAMLQHQKAGVEIGERILREVGYPSHLISDILEIISQHDTRTHFISKNEGLVRDADKLWRFSRTGFAADVTRKNISPNALYEKRVKRIQSPDFFYSEKARQIAREELEARKREFLSFT